MRSAAPGESGNELVVFVLDDHRYALALTAIERVVRAVAIAPLPKGPEIVSGVIDLHGELVPVLNIRRRFRLPERAPVRRDHLIIARTCRRRVALAVDTVEEVITRSSAERVEPATVAPGLEYVRGVTRLEPHGLVFIHDLDSFLSLEEENALAAAKSP